MDYNYRPYRHFPGLRCLAGQLQRFSHEQFVHEVRSIE